MNIETEASTGSEEAKLIDLLSYYRKTVRTHRIVYNLCQSDQHKQLFKRCINHELLVIKARSQDLKDHEISVYQKAFATLMSQDENPRGGIALYAEEILGLRFVGAAEKTGVLRQAIDTRRLVTEKLDSRDSPGSDESNNCSLPQNEESGMNQLEILDLKIPHKLQDNDPKLHRLWDLYQSAKGDFLSTNESEWPSHTSSAKFLRDTAENCINYIQSNQHLNEDRHHQPNDASASEADWAGKMLNELRITVAVAKDAAEKGCGGKKRRFDHNMEGVPRGPRRMRAETNRKTSIDYTPLPAVQNPWSDVHDQRQHPGRRRRETSQDRAEDRATLFHSREPRIARMDHERSASPRLEYSHTFDERNYRFQKSRVSGHDLDYQVSAQDWRRSEAEDYRSSYYRSGDSIGRPGSREYETYHRQSGDRQGLFRSEHDDSSFREPARRERSQVQGRGFPHSRPEKREAFTVADRWRPSS